MAPPLPESSHSKMAVKVSLTVFISALECCGELYVALTEFQLPL